MLRVAAHTDDRLIILGVNVYPAQIESVLLRFEEAEPHYQVIVSREHYFDQITVSV